MAQKKIIETLVTELTADGAKMRNEMKKSLSDAKSWGDKFQSITKTAAIGLGVGAVGAGAGLIALTKSAITNADAMSKQSQIVGMSIEKLSAYSYAADLGGVENGKFIASLTIFNRVTKEAFEGLGKGVDAYGALGISLTDSNGKLKNNTQLFDEIADRFKTMPDGIQKTALAADLFGKSGASLIPVLNGGTESLRDLSAEAERFGLVIDKETGKKAEEFNDNLSKMGKAFEGLGLRIAKDALGPLNDFTKTINDPKTQQGISDIATGIITITNAAVSGAAELANFTKWVGEATARYYNGIDDGKLQDVEQEIQDIKSAIESPVSSWFDFSIPGRVIKMERQELETELARLTNIRDELINAPLPPPKPIDTKPPAPELATNNGVKTLEQLQKEEAEKNAKILRTKMDAEDKARFDKQVKEDKSAMDAAARKQEAADREIVMQKDKFDSIHQEALRAQNLQIELENFQHEQDKKQIEDDLNSLREKHLLSVEMEDGFKTAKEELEISHQARLKDIKDQAAQEDFQRQMIMLQGAQQFFGDLYEISAVFGSRQSKLTRVLFAAQKVASIAQALLSIKTGIAKAQEKGWPAGLVEGIAIAGYGADIINDMDSLNIAHGGMDNVPKESTYLLDKGERVVSPQQNKDLTNFLKEPDAGLIKKSNEVNVTIINQGSAKSFTVERLSEADVRIIARDEAMQVVNKETDNVVSREVANPNSKTSKSLSRNTQAQRRR